MQIKKLVLVQETLRRLTAGGTSMVSDFTVTQCTDCCGSTMCSDAGPCPTGIPPLAL
ncbi:MAG TPA: hypothetical protein VG649_17570 [Candidatus Angelobacter sp.]|jgi:hypothetical protein|nr:hypothetical protein [Candidatus Angelobacter sp.]